MDYTCASWPRRWGGQTKVRCSFPDLVLEQFLEIMQWHQMNETLLTTAWHRSMTDIGEGKVSVRHGRRELNMQQCQTAVWKPNLSPGSKPIQCVLLQCLCLSVTPHEYLMLGEGGRRRNYRQLYCSVYVPLYISLPVFQNHLSGSLSCVQL